MTDLDPLSAAHLAWLTAENNVSPNTIKARRAVLRSLPNPGTTTREHVEAWWATRAHLARATRLADLSHLRQFYDWCQIWEHRPDDPTRRLKAPRQIKGQPRPFAEYEVDRIFAALDTGSDLRRAFALGVYAGLRVSEAAALDWRDVDLENNRLRVELSKGLKTRLVGLSPLLLDKLLPNTGGNVVTAGGPPYTADTLQRKINRAIQRAGVDGTFHRARHRFGSMALQRTGNLLAVSRAMGHQSPATTSIYSQTADTDLDLIAEAVTR